ANNWNGGVHTGKEVGLTTISVDKPFPSAPVKTQTAQEAYELVLDNVGANLPKRDSLDARILEEVRTGTAKYGETYAGGSKGIIDSQKAVGGWPQLNSAEPPADKDNDGMPDEWELKYNMKLDDPSDNKLDNDGDGYTNIEEYLNNTDPTTRP
ncbi:MAG: pectate lyase, partial [Candidatus Poribacteria bacterium]